MNVFGTPKKPIKNDFLTKEYFSAHFFFSLINWFAIWNHSIWFIFAMKNIYLFHWMEMCVIRRPASQTVHHSLWNNACTFSASDFQFACLIFFPFPPWSFCHKYRHHCTQTHIQTSSKHNRQRPATVCGDLRINYVKKKHQQKTNANYSILWKSLKFFHNFCCA